MSHLIHYNATSVQQNSTNGNKGKERKEKKRKEKESILEILTYLCCTPKRATRKYVCLQNCLIFFLDRKHNVEGSSKFEVNILTTERDGWGGACFLCIWL